MKGYEADFIIHGPAVGGPFFFRVWRMSSPSRTPACCVGGILRPFR